MKIVDFYKDMIISSARNSVKKYMKKFFNQTVIVFFEEKTYEVYKDILQLDQIDNLILVNIQQKIDVEKYHATNKNTILVLVESFYYHAKVYKYLRDNDLYYNDICNDILLDLDILREEKLEFFWNNIIKLENTLTSNQRSEIIKRRYSSYSELFKNLLFLNGLIEPNNANAIIYLETYKDTFGELTKNLENFVVFCNRNAEEENFFYGIDHLRFFDFIHLFIGTTARKLPVGSKYININHGIIDDPGPITKSQNNLDNIEHAFHAKHTRSHVDLNIVSSNLLADNNSVSLGYPKLDKFIRFFNENKEKKTPDIIMLAISTIMWNCAKLTPVIQDKEFLNSLLEEFPSYKLIFRPHPDEVDYHYLKSYTNALRHYKNFIYDKEKSYIENFTNTKVFISDALGSSAYTYAFATLRPVIFYIPKPIEYFEDYQHKYYVQNLEIVGDIVTTREDLIKMVHKYMTDSEYVEKKSMGIQTLRDKNIFNIGSSEKEICSFIKNYVTLEQQKRFTSFYIKRFQNVAKRRIDAYFEQFQGKQIAIYGAGKHFETVLLKLYDFTTLDVVCFSDSNEKMIGTTVYNLPVRSKDSLEDIDVILISSKQYEVEIKNDLSRKYVSVFTLYEYLNTEIALFLNMKTDITFKNLLLNMQLLEYHLSENDIAKVLQENFSNYQEFFESCERLITQKYKKEIFYTNEKEKLYSLGDEIFLAKT